MTQIDSSAVGLEGGRHHCCGKIKSFLFISLLKKANCLVVQRPEKQIIMLQLVLKKY